MFSSRFVSFDGPRPLSEHGEVCPAFIYYRQVDIMNRPGLAESCELSLDTNLKMQALIFGMVP